MSAFHEELARLIRQRGWTQQLAAEKLGVNQANISRWLSGSHEPTLSKAAQIAEALGIPLDQLTGGSVLPVNRVQESVSRYGTEANPVTPALEDLRKRYRKAGAKERDAIRMALVVLFPEQWDDVLAWLDKK